MRRMRRDHQHTAGSLLLATIPSGQTEAVHVITPYWKRQRRLVRSYARQQQGSRPNQPLPPLVPERAHARCCHAQIASLTSSAKQPCVSTRYFPARSCLPRLQPAACDPAASSAPEPAARLPEYFRKSFSQKPCRPTTTGRSGIFL